MSRHATLRLRWFPVLLSSKPSTNFNLRLLLASAASSGACVLPRCQDLRPGPGPPAQTAGVGTALPGEAAGLRLPPGSRQASLCRAHFCVRLLVAVCLARGAMPPEVRGTHTVCPRLAPHTRRGNPGISSLFRISEDSR